MSDEKIDKVLQNFLESVTAVLRRHAAALERLTENSKIEHENIRQVTEQVNMHYGILTALDAEVKRRLNFSTEEPSRPVN